MLLTWAYFPAIKSSSCRNSQNCPGKPMKHFVVLERKLEVKSVDSLNSQIADSLTLD